MIHKDTIEGRNFVLEEDSNLHGNPFIVGRWVRGSDHYDRKSLIEYLLTAQDSAFWVVGTRRMGKTSLLRQLEYLTDNRESRYVPLFWDLQGCSSPADLSNELTMAVEDVSSRFAGLGVDFTELEGEDAATVLRRLSRSIARNGRQLLLLVDEAEVLIEIARQDAAWLARLRKSMQEGRLRTIIASTKLLTTLNAHSSDWMTSPFLFGFQMVNLWTLHPEGAKALVRQGQSASPVTASEGLVERVLTVTNSHPYLIQHLCQRLYIPGIGGGSLREMRNEDLAVDHMLAGYFRFDYLQLAPIERRILLAVAEAGTLDEAGLCARLGGCAELRFAPVAAALLELGHLRHVDAGYAIGSEFLQQWLLDNHRELVDELRQDVSSDGVAEMDADELAALARTLGVSAERIQALAKLRISSSEEFEAAIKSFFYEVRHLVEQDDGYKLLVAAAPDGTTTLRSEEDVQIALKHWLRPMCRALNIHMERESLTGRGFLDFAFSLGHDFRCLVEVKLFHSVRLQEGVGIQLPTYMIAGRAKYGVYVPIFLESSDYREAVEALQGLAEERSKSHGVKIDVIDIRAWKPEAASKAEAIEERNRYQPDGLRLRQLEKAGEDNAEEVS